jgi:predicted AAA+ superfamily ATPase
MTIDERLDRLTERHEALTQSVESLAVSTRETTDLVRALVAAQKMTDEHVNSLARIAEIHERRLTSLEGSDEPN